MFVYTIEHVIGAIVILGLVGVVAYYKLSIKYWAWKGRRIAQAALKERAEEDEKEAAIIRAERPDLTDDQIAMQIHNNRIQRSVRLMEEANARLKGKITGRDQDVNARMERDGRIVVNPQSLGGVKIQNSGLSGAHVQNNLANDAAMMAAHITSIYDERLVEAALMEQPEPHVNVTDCPPVRPHTPTFPSNVEEGRKTDDSESINHRTDFRPCAPVNRPDSDEASSGRWLGESGGAAKGWNDSPSSSSNDQGYDSGPSTTSYD